MPRRNRTPPGSDTAARMGAAFRRLNLRDPLPEARLRLAVDRLVVLARHGPGGSDAAFAMVGSTRTRKEMEAIAAAADASDPAALGEALAALHAPAIAALAAIGIVRAEAATTPDLARRVRGAARRLQDWSLPPSGAPRDNRTRLVARLVLDDYIELTGNNPALPDGSTGLARLTGDVLRELGIAANPRQAVEAALGHRAARAAAEIELAETQRALAAWEDDGGAPVWTPLDAHTPARINRANRAHPDASYGTPSFENL